MYWRWRAKSGVWMGVGWDGGAGCGVCMDAGVTVVSLWSAV